ncbi:replication protein A 70 kDa DNA-binding subunit B [Tanacetum coccineum]
MEINMTQLCDLDLMLDDAKILARVISIWMSHPKQRPNEVWSLDAVLQDQMGNRVQATVRNQDIKKFQPILDEGACYRISNFGIGENGGNILFVVYLLTSSTVGTYRFFLRTYQPQDMVTALQQAAQRIQQQHNLHSLPSNSQGILRAAPALHPSPATSLPSAFSTMTLLRTPTWTWIQGALST